MGIKHILPNRLSREAAVGWLSHDVMGHWSLECFGHAETFSLDCPSTVWPNATPSLSQQRFCSVQWAGGQNASCLPSLSISSVQ